MIRSNKNACLLLLVSLFAVATVSSPVARAADDTELAKHMEEMQDNLKKLRKSVKSAEENTASLETLAKVQAAAVASKVLVPAKAATVPEADRAKFVAGYRKDMVALLEQLGKIEVALLDNENAKAEELFKALKGIEEAGHEKYSE